CCKQRFERRVRLLGVGSVDLDVDQGNPRARLQRRILDPRQERSKRLERIVVPAEVAQLPGMQIVDEVALVGGKLRRLRVELLEQGLELGIVRGLEMVRALQQFVRCFSTPQTESENQQRGAGKQTPGE